MLRGHGRRDGRAGERLHPARHRPDHAVRLRARAARAEEAPDLGDEVERHLPSRCRIWDERAEAMAREYPDVKADKYHIDILTAHFVGTRTGSTSSSDRISSETSCRTSGRPCTGHDRHRAVGEPEPGARVPVACSSRSTARLPTSPASGIANPIGQIWSGAMMLEHLGHPEAADAVVRAIERSFGRARARRTWAAARAPGRSARRSPGRSDPARARMGEAEEDQS